MNKEDLKWQIFKRIHVVPNSSSTEGKSAYKLNHALNLNLAAVRLFYKTPPKIANNDAKENV
jgi:hypothetical protein